MHNLQLEFAKTLRVEFSHDRRKTVGSSEIGRCARSVAYDKLGYEPDIDQAPTNGFAVRGDIIENHWTAPMLRHWAKQHGGALHWSGQHDQVTFASEGVPISSTPDGLATGISQAAVDALSPRPHGIKLGRTTQLVTEMKSFDPRIGDSKLPKREHIPQVQTQLGLIRSATKYRPQWGALVYVNASDLFDVRVFGVKWHKREFENLVKRADLILKTKDPSTLMPEGKLTGECSMCKHAKKCLGFLPFVPDDDPKAPTKTMIASVEAVAAKVVKLSTQKDRVTRQHKEAEAELYMTLNSIRRNFVKGKEFVVHAKKTASQNRTDAKKLADLARTLGATDAQIEACKSPTKEGSSLSVEAL